MWLWFIDIDDSAKKDEASFIFCFFLTVFGGGVK